MKKAVCMLVKLGPAYLAVTRRNTGMVGLVGGKVDPGETEVQAIVREAEEEVGLKLDPAQFREVFTMVCPGEVDYLTTTFVYPDLDGSCVLDIKPESGIDYQLVSKDVLCDKRYTPFADYNTALFESLENQLEVTE